jgi:hypothetical protein
MGIVGGARTRMRVEAIEEVVFKDDFDKEVVVKEGVVRGVVVAGGAA